MFTKDLLVVLLLAGFAGAAPAPEENWERFQKRHLPDKIGMTWRCCPWEQD
jgi:hypothetical protein